MAEEQYTIRDARSQLVQVQLKRDKRLRRTSRWERLADGSLLVRVPVRFPKHGVHSLLDQIARQLDKTTTRRQRCTDAELNDRAELINRKYFNGEIQWNAIRWVSNMHRRLGSCSRGGPSDGQIRISDKIKPWPQWVVDYVIAHELLHRKHPDHSPAFWAELRRAYPLAERARGFIQGVGFGTGHPVEDEPDG